MKRKALAYITRRNNKQVLVFWHKHYPEAGLQVPVGTVEDGKELPLPCCARSRRNQV